MDTTILSPAREAGVVYTKPWMVELVLDLAGYLPEKRLAELVVLEPSAGDGAFLSAMVRRLVESFLGQGPILRAVPENEGRMVNHGRIFNRPMGTLIRRPFTGPPGMPRPLVAAQNLREAHSAWPQATRSLPSQNPPLTTHSQTVQMTA
jgi:hypothetical protein